MNKKWNGKCFVWSGRVETKIGCLLSVTTHCISTKSLVRWMRWNITKKYMSGNLPWVKIFSIKCKKEQTQQATVEVFYCLILKLHNMANMRWWVISGNQQNSIQNACNLNNFLHIEYKTISDGGITVDFWFIKVHTSNWSSDSWGSSNTLGSSNSSCWDHQRVGDYRIPLDL